MHRTDLNKIHAAWPLCSVQSRVVEGIRLCRLGLGAREHFASLTGLV